ncbi:MAG: adenine-specific methyltransferase EcoRI family protein [Spirochaetaceae bacterium]|jgi:hypothetical protein|nr:adenine-specific methyltransferase EcoRI family protein [Spirochaetaceae bacterium]
MGNKTLNSAGKAKNDEFYTQISDIAKECSHYKEHFKGETIFCNCDDPYESEFIKYFALSFNHLGLKKLLASCYIGSPIANTQLSLFDYESAENKTTKSPHRIEITEVADEDAEGLRGLPLVENLLRNRKNALARLQGDGDFRSAECVEMLKEADIVVTNPPFSLFREYVAQLMEYDKKFLIIGNKNAITYKETFKLIKENKMWIGRMPMGTDMLFNVPGKYSKNFLENKKEGSAYRIVDGVIKGRSQACWFTNIDHKKRHEKFRFYRKYTAELYPHYDNYDAIEVSKVADIPEDWDGVMGVPITFLDKYNPAQFEIIGIDRYVEDNPHYGQRFKLDGKEIYARILIKMK